MSAKDPAPSPEELRDCLSDLFYIAVQCTGYHQWALSMNRQFRNRPSSKFDLITLFRNSLSEATLLYVRKTDEFFKPLCPNHKADTLFAYRFRGYKGLGPVIPDEARIELHKRIGHLTI